MSKGLTMYFAYFSLIGGLVFVGLSIRNFTWSKRFAAGECPFRVEDPRRMLEAFRKVHMVGVLLAGSLAILIAGILNLVGGLISRLSNDMFEPLSVTFFLFAFSIFLFATSRYFVGFLTYMERLARKTEGIPSIETLATSER